MRDFSQWIEYSGASEGSGRSEKVWLMDPVTRQIGLFKYKKDLHTTDHISECIAYKLACLLGMECARFEVGIYNGREGSMSYNIVTTDNQVLIEGINYINIFIYNRFFVFFFFNHKKFSINLFYIVLCNILTSANFLAFLSKEQSPK